MIIADCSMNILLLSRRCGPVSDAFFPCLMRKESSYYRRTYGIISDTNPARTTQLASRLPHGSHSRHTTIAEPCPPMIDSCFDDRVNCAGDRTATGCLPFLNNALYAPDHATSHGSKEEVWDDE